MFSSLTGFGAAQKLLSLCHDLEVERFPLQADIDTSGVSVLRLDRIHPVLSGNKLFKLLCHWQPWQGSGRSGWVTPGGVWSNHLHAVAFLGQWAGVRTTGLVRGYDDVPLTATLQDCVDWGMQLVFQSRVDYRQRYDQDWQRHWSAATDSYFIGEGGAWAASTEMALLSGLDGDDQQDPGAQAFAALAAVCAGYDQVWLAAGSGTTAERLLPRLPADVHLVAVNTVADHGALAQRWQRLFAGRSWQIVASSMRRFGAQSDALRGQITAFDRQGLPLDPVYGAPLVDTWLQHAALWQGQSVLLIHGGGLQGRRGIGLDVDVSAGGQVAQVRSLGQ
ncbi:hypothetical protein [Oceanobacter sp. 3_MG-2023]|uniref:hypothetical protein n=1 Tax=Oceanobacter sp. 3_MG-2023 TaxID=3062622 RepID=UPI0027363C22|nr:hypothetical protein [Oceanobacter sp. 3_MG-2023]MDP2504800.1 hypothetical protein [Oceanobacter sp. 3_MG-2023]